ncbi:MAG: hypothetical protein SFU83_00540 [Meiothermus sp.]|nr:hypothetical protein [Meiothermus sp.]
MVRDAKEMSPDGAVEAAKAKLRESLRRAEEELRQTVENSQEKLYETVDGLQNRLTGAVELTQNRLLGTVDGLQERLHHTADHTQELIFGTLDGMQERIHATTDRLGQSARGTAGRLGEGIRRPLELARKHPLEAVTVAALAGLTLGLLRGGGRPDRREKRNDRGQAKAQQTAHQGGNPVLTGLAATGLGKMIWDSLREQYLTPENVRSVLSGVLGGRRGEPR